jgi:glycosyltransferase involved in cell wall biosynthesis
MENKTAIVVATYNRPQSLFRLLRSLEKSNYPNSDIPLIISIDKSDSNECEEVARNFDWRYGVKKIIVQPEHLGLKSHILKCGELSKNYASIILLEDDLLVSQHFYHYSTAALSFYENTHQIAGVSLYSYQIAENGFFPFYPIDDGYDVYFMQVAASWGWCFTPKWWNNFTTWLKTNDTVSLPANMPAYIRQWSADSWKKHFIRYLIEKDKCFVFPRRGLCTNFAEWGTNSDRKGLFQTPLLQSEITYDFPLLSSSKSIYDAWFEIKPHVLQNYCPDLDSKDLEVDLHGTKDISLIDKEFLLSSKPCYQPIKNYGNDLPGATENIVSSLPGEFYSFGKKEHFKNSSTEISLFYTGISSIVNLAFKTYFDFPPFLVIIRHEDASADELHKTIESVLQQNYPASQVYICVCYKNEKPDVPLSESVIQLYKYSNPQEFLSVTKLAIQSANPVYCVALNTGDTFYSGVFSSVNSIFKIYPYVHWVTGISTYRTKNGVNLADAAITTRRWSKNIFYRSIYKHNSRQITPSATFWRRSLWDQTVSNINIIQKDNWFHDICIAFFEKTVPYTCNTYLSSIPQSVQSLRATVFLEDSIISRVKEFLFINNVPYFRYFYKTQENFVPVIRYHHPSGSYFMYDY